MYDLFGDQELVAKIKTRLPKFFQLAELENSRSGKVTMEVGTAREKIISALLIYKFGEQNINTAIPAVESEIDVYAFGKPISIKTITGLKYTGVKMIWTVDPAKARAFADAYYPKMCMLLARISWDRNGGLHYIPVETQIEVFQGMGKERFIKLPKEGTNPRGVELTKEALSELVNHGQTLSISINWKKEELEFDPFGRWVDLWKME